MKNFTARGDVLEITAPAALASGEGVQIGAIFGVAAGAIANGARGNINLTGEYDLPKTASQAWTVGARVYWDAAEGECTTVGTGNILIGVARLAVGSGAGETLGRVRLNGMSGARAAFVANAASGSAAEINALRDAIIAAGLMASS